MLKKRSYSPEFRSEAVKLIQEQGLSQEDAAKWRSKGAHVLAVSRSGFYTWLKGIPSARAQEDERLKVAIRAAHTGSRGTYGVQSRLHPELASEGCVAGRDRIAH